VFFDLAGLYGDGITSAHILQRTFSS
jgi:hypothetical protein